MQKRILFVLLLIPLALPVHATLSGKAILQRSLELAATIKDYTAQVSVTVDLPGVKVPQRQARVYFKRPDKVAIDSKGIVMIPKRALVPGMTTAQLGQDIEVVLLGTKMTNGVPFYSLKVIPTGKQRSSDRMLATVRGDRFTIEHLEMYSGNQRELVVDWRYQLIAGKYWLPQTVVARIHTPPSAASRTPRDPDNPTPSPAKASEGTISVVFSQVKVNTGLSDTLFKEINNGAATGRHRGQ